MSPRKRYTRRQSELLFARLLDYVADRDDHALTEGRALLMALLGARFGEYVVGDKARQELTEWTADRVRERFESLSLFFRMFYVPVGFDIKIGEIWMRVARAGRDVVVRVDAAAADALTFQEINLIRTAQIRQLQPCDCGKLFARIGRQEYCSERCQKRVYMKALRAEERAALEAVKRKGVQRGKTTRTR